MMHSHLDSFIYTLLSTDAHHNSKTVLGFSIYDSSTMEDLNHQPIKWNGSELNHEVFLSVSLSKERNLCYTVFALTKKAVLNTGLTNYPSITNSKAWNTRHWKSNYWS